MLRQIKCMTCGVQCMSNHRRCTRCWKAFREAKFAAKSKAIRDTEVLSKVCGACGVEKRHTEFGAGPDCNACLEDFGRAKSYGLSRDQFIAATKEANGHCRICQKPSKLVIDHDHETGAVRGLLCGKCNTMLGMADENLVTLLRAVVYLKKPVDLRAG